MITTQRWSKPAHSMGVSLAVPHSSFVPTPNMTPLQIARAKGAEAKRLGRRDSDNPHTDMLASPSEGQLSEEWTKGYNGG